MKKIELNKKIIIVIVLAVLAIVLGVLITVVVNLNNPNEVANTSKKLVEDKRYGDLFFSNIEVIEEEKNHIMINVTNRAKEAFKQEYVNFVFKKENNDVIDTIGVVIPNIEASGNSRIDMVVDKKVLDAYTFTIEKSK